MRSVIDKNGNSACLRFLVMSPYPYFFFNLVPEHNSANRLKYLNDTWLDYRTDQFGVSYTRMTTQLVFIF